LVLVVTVVLVTVVLVIKVVTEKILYWALCLPLAEEAVAVGVAYTKMAGEVALAVVPTWTTMEALRLSDRETLVVTETVQAV
jgi:hypothetical protein